MATSSRSTLAQVLIPSLQWGGALAGAVAVVGGLVGWLVAGPTGLVGGLSGAIVAGAFLGLTAVSFLIAARVTKGDPGHPAFYGIVLGASFVKLIVFLVLLLWLRGQTWLDPAVFIFTAIIAIAGSLIVDAVVSLRRRVPYTDAKLPGDDDETRS